ncbi:MAG: MarP family serine protease [Actinobacteria bacterium]|nr:MAG: MarP family serine protease [Actinomycetota bacterium]
MTIVDWLAVALVLVAALGGAAQGFVWSSLSLVGLAVGAVVGGRIAPLLLAGGAHSQYAPVIALAGAVTFALVFEVIGSTVGAALRRRERRFLREADSMAGVVAGALIGLVVVWVLGAMALQLPGQTKLRRAAQRSLVLRHLNAIVPPGTILNALARIDPFPRLAGPPVPTQPPDPRVLRQPGVRAAAPSVVRVLGTACGLGVEGSGWVARRGLVVTAAHVVAGETDTTVTTVSGRTLGAQAVAFDPRNDVAVLRVPGLSARPLRLADPKYGTAVAIVGYPQNGPFDAVPGRVGSTVTVLTQDAYGRGPVARTVTSLSGDVRHGDSGGAAVDASGAVQASVFAARVNGSGGYGIPAAVVRRDLKNTRVPVTTGPCT